jgi:hypothetical protein
VETYHDYLRTYSAELGARIVEMYPPLQGPKDPIAPALKTLLRKPLPAQAMTITGIAKYLTACDWSASAEQARRSCPSALLIFTPRGNPIAP